jgi:selenide,water dikinase
VLGGLPVTTHPDLLVGLEKADDAGVFRLAPDLAAIQTIDYFTPIVDDPFEFGAIAAANSFSDVYAMGGTPITAMNVVGFPTTELEMSVLGEILRGGLETIREADAVLVGGHSVKAPELFYGLSVLGRVHPDRVVTNAGAQPDDRLVLTKPLGTGILTTALKQGALPSDSLARVTRLMKRLNRAASEAMVELGAHACTDITGYGLLGHLFEMTRSSGVDAYVYAESVPLIEGVLEHARAGHKAGGLFANRSYLESRISISSKCDPERLDALLDPQTSGGLLVSLPLEAADAYMERLGEAGEEAAIIGEVRPGTGTVQVLP